MLDAGASLSLSLDKVATLTKRLSLAAPEPTFPAKTFFGTTCDLQEWRAWEVHRKRCVGPRRWKVRSVSRMHMHMHTRRVCMCVRGYVHVRAGCVHVLRGVVWTSMPGRCVHVTNGTCWQMGAGTREYVGGRFRAAAGGPPRMSRVCFSTCSFFLPGGNLDLLILLAFAAGHHRMGACSCSCP